jgi:DNA repair protein RecO (recombination protein O)
MRRFSTQGIVLARTNYGEADRILTFLTPDNGKLKAIAKGVRKQKSKLAGGIELFSISELSLIVGKSEINTLISTRLIKYYSQIVKDLDRTNLAYELIKITNKATEDNPEPAYFNLLNDCFQALDDDSIATELVQVWFYAQLLKLAGHSPNLSTEKSGDKLQAGQKYNFDHDAMCFIQNPSGSFGADQIKFLRLLFSNNQPKALRKVQGIEKLAKANQGLIQSMLSDHVRI